MCFYFREQPTSHFNPFESMDLVKTGRKLSTFVWRRLKDIASRKVYPTSVKCNFFRNWLLISLRPHEKTKCSLQLQKDGSKNNRSLHRVPFFWIHQTTSEGMTFKMTKKFSRSVWANVYSLCRKNHAICWLCDQKATGRGIPASQ